MTKVWKYMKLGNVCKTSSGGTPLKNRKDFYEGGTIPWLRSGEVNNRNIVDCEIKITDAGLKGSSAKLFPPRTVVVAMYGATAGQVGILNFECSTNQAVCGIYPNDKFIPEFLYYKFLEGYTELVSLATGGAQPNISQEKIKNTLVPLIPLQEQQQIVNILDEAFEAIDQAKANIEKNIANAKELFQSKLNDIFSQKGEGWEEKSLGELGTLTSSKRIFKNEYVSEGIPFYRSKEIKELSHGKEISLELYISSERYNEIKSKFGVPQKGDILLTAVGTIGEMYVVEGDRDFYFKDGNIMWLKDFNTLNPNYLRYALSNFVEQLKSMSQGAAYSALTIEKLKKYKVPLPNMDTQNKIVDALDDIHLKSNQLSDCYAKKLSDLEELKNSILQKAFNGELTSTNSATSNKSVTA